MSDLPDDIYTELARDVDTLKNLGPLRALAGVWEGTKSLDINPKAEGPERQEFLRAIDAVKKRTQRQLKRSVYLSDVVADTAHHQERRLQDDREVVQTAAQEVLSERQQDILRLSFEGWAVQEIADQLGIAPERVSDEKYKAVRKLRQHLKVD